jgi:SP family general alpha glucoside:H+ symporter-like MFS transporter
MPKMDTKPDYEHHDAENKLAGIEHDEDADARGLKEDAYNQEAIEANMTLIQAVKAYPMATFWAFVMSFTIVSLC